MYLLYVDDAGSVSSARQRHFVLGGICVFERQAYWLSQALEEVAQRTGHPEPGELEFHGSHILPGKGWWRSQPKDSRRTTLRHGLAAARSLRGNDWRLFGVVVNKAALSPEDPIEYAFEQLCNRFDRFLQRKYRDSGVKQRGLIVFDKSTRETRLQSLTNTFRDTGHRWGVLRNLVDVPFFVDSKATRLIQYADLVAYALWQKFERGDSEFFDVIDDKFDSEGGVVHGLHHYKMTDEYCDCPACSPRLI